MSTLAADCLAFLGAQPEITARVGNRLRETTAPLTDPPSGWGNKQFVVVRRERETAPLDLAGGSDVLESQLVVQCFGTGAAEAEGLATLVRRALNGYRGAWNGREIMGVMLEDGADDHEALPPGSDRLRNVVDLTFQVFSRDE